MNSEPKNDLKVEIADVDKKQADFVPNKTVSKLNWQSIVVAVIIGVLLSVLGYSIGVQSMNSKIDSMRTLPPNHLEVPEWQKNLLEARDSRAIPPPPSIPEPSAQTPEERIGITVDSGYSFKYGSIYYKDEYVADLYVDNAEYVGGGFIKDGTKLFFNGELLPGVDPSTCTTETLDKCSDSFKWRDILLPYSLDVTWNEKQLSAEEIISAGGCRDQGFVVGIVNNGALAGGSVLIQNDNVCDMWCSASTPKLTSRHFVKFADYLIPVNDFSGFTFREVMISDTDEALIDIPNSDFWLTRGETIGFGNDEDDKAEYLFTDAVAGPIYRSENNCFVSERPDHVKLSYRLGFDFIDESTGVLDINLLNGSKNNEAYQYISTYQSCYTLIDEEVLKPNERLVKVGEFPNGNEVYKLAESKDQTLVSLYEDKNTLASYQDGKNKYSYVEFLSFNPYLYWKDPFGGWVQFMNKRFETAAEKCKPVIYLYPEKTGNFDVYVEPNAGFTHTIPDYGSGWHVSATPNSQITDKVTGKIFPYLYWAGINTGIPKITEGWMVPQSDIERFLVEKLKILGLIDQEITDFNEYWVPRLESEGADKYKIMFLPQHLFEPLAPLTVEGDETPESIIRVMMYAQPASGDEILPEQTLPPTPKRTGFTVVEWGGALFN